MGWLWCEVHETIPDTCPTHSAGNAPSLLQSHSKNPDYNGADDTGSSVKVSAGLRLWPLYWGKWAQLWRSTKNKCAEGLQSCDPLVKCLNRNRITCGNAQHGCANGMHREGRVWWRVWYLWKPVDTMDYDSLQLSCCMQSWQEDADIRSQLSVEAHNFM